ncbi:histidine kinase dimerization/phospho-acceptor domain-containing protein [Sphingomonas sp. R1]|uniref:ATP-binding protein n=1 Tax=Sphingomonas sp. R1 TaxID=399176 RepID=UPI002224CE7E|nr:histidine kinase dimerization/phospho-acceptor domain-containing protein [Sphingomonas sp. R1]UYY77756.1 sensor histidine kinase [Sphingomonas sp. R1]
MRYDDTLETVLAGDVRSATGAPLAWRQLVDLIGRGRVPADDRAMEMLASIRTLVPIEARIASARALEGACPPPALVLLLAVDDLRVALPVLRTAQLSEGDWLALLPKLAPGARHVLRNRRDLAPAILRALESFGPADFVLPDHSDAGALGADAQPSMRGEDAPDGLFAVADLMARIARYRQDRDHFERGRPPERARSFRFETDAMGVVRWVEGVRREPVIGLSLDLQGLSAGSRLDGVASGAFRRRAGFTNARLTIAGESDAGGDWLVSGLPVFDQVTGRFTGYRGNARRPRSDERAEPQRVSPEADALRQIVHELRTPTNAIAGFAEMIETEMLGPVPEPYRDRAAVIRAQARELLGAIDDLDLAARIESAALSLSAGRVAVRPLLAGIVDDLGELLALRGSSIALAPGELFVAGDPRAIERLLARLLATLVSATAAEERLCVRFALEGDGQVAIRIDRPRALGQFPGDAVLGIDDEHEEDGALLGTGFALRLARNLARELGGSLRIAPDLLTLRLPAAAAEAAAEQAHRH